MQNFWAVRCGEDTLLLNRQRDIVLKLARDVEICHVWKGEILRVIQGEEHYFLRIDGSELCRSRFLDAGSFCEGLARVKEPGGWGVIDTTGQVIIKGQYETLGNYSEGLACAGRGGRKGFIGRNGATATPFKYREGYAFGCGLALVAVEMSEAYGRRLGYISNRGEMVIEPRFSDAISFNEGIAFACERRQKYGLLWPSGEWAVEPCFDQVLLFAKGLGVVGRDGKWGFCDVQGEIQIPFLYDSALPFSEGLACVQLGRHWGYISRTGRTVVPFVLDSTGSFFTDGLAELMVNGKDAIVDANGGCFWCEGCRGHGGPRCWRSQ